ncbi:cytochrome C oxidase subunit II [Pseudogracilibacillus auburnensis]|uniref:Cytochrome aa3 subunit 2 n=1 Tax=Pseudogracilibacillus auburnensis TaxID=1494959 RepID=A0A2V3W8K6_9BACI|nr:cytochrome C oxidase subunit II [Pseudogracilibacillus auburnensis]PXW89518.1 cytochrome c oxidase subunit 2 [Pseudogracilibacillus auburnensis]
MIQLIVWYATLLFIILLAVVFGWVAFSSKKKQDYAPIIKRWYKARSIYGVLLVVLMLVVTIYTLRELPFNEPSHVEGVEVIPVHVEAFQFGFELNMTEFSVGDTVEFNVTTKDVTHGFGVYDPDMVLVGQTQAMPEYTNTFYLTFDQPGTYQVLCLEYCGLAHHMMMTEMVVK